MSSSATFEIERADLYGRPDFFERFRVTDPAVALQTLRVAQQEELLVFDLAGQRRGFLLRQLGYHHVAEGELMGEPFVISFCAICHSGVRFDPRVEGRRLHLSTGGLYNGVALLIDDETGTYWDHMTGRALHGPLAGKQLDAHSLHMTTVGSELERSDCARIWVSKLKLKQWLMSMMCMRAVRGSGFFPPGFRRTLAPANPRQPEFAQGLGVIVKDQATFYPKDRLRAGAIEDRWAGMTLKVAINPRDGVPFAVTSDGRRPLQLFLRWYGFSANYPGCRLFE
ncbi:MAG: DUF3179 domain-containing (seleno)protein [Myxococcales bacterium]